MDNQPVRRTGVVVPVGVLGFALLVAAASHAGPVFFPRLSDESAACNECHRQQTPAIVQ